MKMLTIQEAYQKASSFLKQYEVSDGAFCAELLIRHLLKWDRTRFFLHWHELFPADQQELLHQFLQRRAEGEPVQYILGEQEFYGLPFYVSPSVLIPRPETELLVEQIIEIGGQLWPDAGDDSLRKAGADFSSSLRQSNVTPAVADIGTGSGIIPITIAVKRPDWHITASDLSAEALVVAKQNALRHQVDGRITFYEGDLLRPYIERGQSMDILVSNPPYIAQSDLSGLQKEVRDFEPHTALVGGEDGFVLYRRMLEMIRELPHIPRLIGFELGIHQAGTVAGWIKEMKCWDEVKIVPDLAGIDRHVIAWKK